MPELKVFALKKLDMIVDEFWPEISEAIEKMYVLYISSSIFFKDDFDVLFNRMLYFAVRFFMKIRHFHNMT